MLKYTPYVLKTLWRHRARTLLTVAGTAGGLFVFSFVGSVQEGLAQLTSQRETEEALIVFQDHKFCPATSHLPQDYARKIADVPGVRDVVPIRVFTNNCRASLAPIVFYGIPPEKLPAVRDFELLDGSMADFESHRDGALIGRGVARRRGLAPGDRIEIGDYAVNVVGVFACEGDPTEENYIYTHLEFLQRGRERNLVGTVTQHEVLLDGGADPDATCRAIDEALRGGPVDTATRPKSAFRAKSVGDLAQLIGLSHYLALACVGLVLALVATTSIMAVQDRAGEHAVMQTLGFSGKKIFALVLSESVVLGLVGGLIGVAAAMTALVASGLSVGAEAVTISFTPSWRLAAAGALVSLATGLTAGLIPACRAATAQIVPALRQLR